MDPVEMLRAIARLAASSPSGLTDRAAIGSATGIDDPVLGQVLEELANSGLISGADVAELLGPVAGVELTHAGRQLIATHPADRYLGYQISAEPMPRTGTRAGHRFLAMAGDELVLALEFEVSYTAAAVSGHPPDELAEQVGAQYLKGVLALGQYTPGATLWQTLDSLNRLESNEIPDDDLELYLLRALRVALLSEARTADVPHLDVEGLALVLGVPGQRVREALVQLEARGYVAASAATFGRSLASGAGRITALGLERLSASPSPPAGAGDSTRQAVDAPRAFISYSHSSTADDELVLGLANRLRAMGVDTDLDIYEPAPTEGWPRWMATMIDRADVVLVVASEPYYRRAMGQETNGRGLGATYEGTLINQAIYEAGGENDKFVPVVFGSESIQWIPDFLRPYTRYDLSRDDDYEALYRRITRQPRVVRPPLGDIVEFLPEGAARPSDTPWHVDLCFGWDHGGGPTRYLASWAPEAGFYLAADLEQTLSSAGGVPAPEGLALDQGIAASLLPGNTLHFEFTAPATPVTARIHVGSALYEPHERGGGARRYLTFRLQQVPELS